MVGKVLEVDGVKQTSKITSFIRRIVERASTKGVVVGLSGGVDSALVGALCVRALGKDRVLGILMPSDHTPAEDIIDARSLAKSWGIRTEEVPVTKFADVLFDLAKVQGTRLARANVEARVRMVILYYHANTLGYLVAGTGDRSEEVLGFFTKFGDGGADFLPIAHLFKTQVRQLGAYLGLPKAVVEKPASPQLWPGHLATDEIPADYERLDIALRCMFDLKMKPAEASRRAGIPVSAVRRVLEMHRRSEHKRRVPPSLA